MLTSGFWLNKAFITGTVIATSPIAEKRITNICRAPLIYWGCYTKLGSAWGRYTFSSVGTLSYTVRLFQYHPIIHLSPAKDRRAAAAAPIVLRYTAPNGPRRRWFAVFLHACGISSAPGSTACQSPRPGFRY